MDREIITFETDFVKWRFINVTEPSVSDKGKENTLKMIFMRYNTVVALLFCMVIKSLYNVYLSAIFVNLVFNKHLIFWSNIFKKYE